MCACVRVWCRPRHTSETRRSPPKPSRRSLRQRPSLQRHDATAGGSRFQLKIIACGLELTTAESMLTAGCTIAAAGSFGPVPLRAHSKRRRWARSVGAFSCRAGARQNVGTRNLGRRQHVAECDVDVLRCGTPSSWVDPVRTRTHHAVHTTHTHAHICKHTLHTTQHHTPHHTHGTSQTAPHHITHISTHERAPTQRQGSP